MKRNFDAALKAVLKHEGGFVNHPSDPGGATNKGITIGTMRRYIDKQATVDDLKRITDAQVATIYKRHYWDAVRGDELPDGVDYAVFDYAVNSGPSRAAKYLQGVVGASVDGKIGPLTIEAVKRNDPRRVINELCDRRMVFLQGLKTWPTFGKGWTRRVADVRKDALAMASSKPASKPVSKQTPVVETEYPPNPERSPAGLLVAIAAAIAGIFAWMADAPCNLIGVLCS